MLHHSLDEILAVNETIRQFMHSIFFYTSVLIVVVLMTGILVILGFTAVNRLEPSLNKTDIFRRPSLSMLNGPVKRSKDASISDRAVIKFLLACPQRGTSHTITS